MDNSTTTTTTTTTGLTQLRKANTTLQKENAVLRRKNELLQHAADTSPRAGRPGRPDSQMSSRGTGAPGTSREHIDWRGKQPSFMRATEASLQREDDTAAKYHLHHRHASPAVEEAHFVRREPEGKGVVVRRGEAVTPIKDDSVAPAGRREEEERLERTEVVPVKRYDSGPSSDSSPVPGSQSSPTGSEEESLVRGHDDQVSAVDESKLDGDSELV
ncbi:hypothetical protein B0H67DRAFT_322878 [Lasiosphaeris hirsuta]|uniref:Uncharacterized protein n=1 Tax=Lasiosphaeris hirsuta TaxID=260670 RepID=A0AA40A2E8_9PEZI|nr:hypothetical protein B0H67DRAFT_322878 [Lasiosphaeris hirsuta]